MTNPEDNLIALMTNKEITKLYKTLLEIIEDQQKEHNAMMLKVKEKAGEEFAKNIDYFTQQKYEQLRKRILDNGNECERGLLNFLGFFDSTINVQRVNDAAQQKVIYKKTMVSLPVIL